ncbi:MAG: GNAT family N-acetyltransferase [Candidatus Heimdallarchaeota archaeon]|nr:GNAT family N-acetyltransferase [Candidatus Heimdallarchaeota archaeon]
MKVKFEVLTSYEQLTQHFSDFVPLTMDYFIWNFQFRYDVYPDSWRKWTGMNDYESFEKVIDKFQVQKTSKMFSKEFVQRIKKDYRKGMWSFLLYSMEDILIGTARLTKRNENECELHSLFIDQQFRGNQLGKKLLQKMIEVAKNEGFEVIYLSTFPFWGPAIKLYEEMGFIRCDFIDFGNMNQENKIENGEIFMRLNLISTTQNNKVQPSD